MYLVITLFHLILITFLRNTLSPFKNHRFWFIEMLNIVLFIYMLKKGDIKEKTCNIVESESHSMMSDFLRLHGLYSI